LNTAPRPVPAWRGEGWSPLLSCKIYPAQKGGRAEITGDFDEEFLELYLPDGQAIDRDSPVFIRRRTGKPHIFEVSFLCSDPFKTHHVTTIAFSTKLGRASDETIRRANIGDPAACNTLGQLLLEIDDPVAARPYLECALDGGCIDAAIDLAVIALFNATQNPNVNFNKAA
jgi:hypothetical protein